LVGITPPGAPPHILSANQTRYNEIPSIPPPVFNPAGVAIDNMDGLEITRIDVNGDHRHDTWVYFSLDPASPSAFAGGAAIYVSPPGVMGYTLYAPAGALGLQQGDDIDALAVWDNSVRGQVNPNVDCVIFSLRPGSPSLAGRSPADVFVSALNGTN